MHWSFNLNQLTWNWRLSSQICHSIVGLVASVNHDASGSKLSQDLLCATCKEVVKIENNDAFLLEGALYYVCQREEKVADEQKCVAAIKSAVKDLDTKTPDQVCIDLGVCADPRSWYEKLSSWLSSLFMWTEFEFRHTRDWALSFQDEINQSPMIVITIKVTIESVNAQPHNYTDENNGTRLKSSRYIFLRDTGHF